MCGIARCIGFRSDVAAFQVRAMMGSLVRRGPDDAGLHSWNDAVLGHRRLSIFDLSEAGRQPMVTTDRKIGVVFNGAIYNFRELRRELENCGCRFNSNTDTEILLHGYREWGIERLLGRLHGMFAIGLWDNNARKFYLIRDRLGVKPLYYTTGSNGSLAFASTARALRSAGLAGDLNPLAMAEFLEFGYVTDARSIYEGIGKLRAGHMLEWSDGVLRESCYWTPPVAVQRSSVTFDEAVEGTERLLLDAVKMRLFADVPVGALLSGGIDSGLICWAIAHLGGNLTAYTVATPNDPEDESSDAAATARTLGIPHRILSIRPEEITSIDDLTAAYGEPFACSSALGMLQLSRIIKPEATVLLTGDGGDDVFLGYPEHKHLWMAQRLAYSIPGPLAKGWYRVRSLAGRFQALRRPMHFLDYATGGLAAVAAAHDGWPNYERHGLLGERFDGIQLPQRRMEWSPAAGRRVLTDMLTYDRNGRFVGEYMTKVDGGTMFHALEARSPFLDQKLWEFASALPYGLRLRKGQLKAVLRELARRHLGSAVARGRKRGFTIPAQRWLVRRWLPQAQEAFHDSLLGREGWINNSAVLAHLESSVAGGRAPLQLWYLYVLENWLRHEKLHESSSSPLTAATAEV